MSSAAHACACHRAAAAPDAGTAPVRRAPAPNPLWRRLATGVQPKSTLGHADDPAEREAERTAAAVVAAPATGHLCSACAAEQAAGGTVQRKADASPAPAPTGALPDAGTGRPLAADVRHDMEGRFGADFGSVRVHDGPQAAAAAQGLHAQAYTAGRDVVFGAGAYAPHTAVGRHLLAHELTHVLQQGGSGRAALQRQPQVTCSIDVIKAARVLRGDRSAAIEVLDCCESGLSPLPAGCTSDLIAAARFLLGRRGGSSGGPSCPPGFRPARTRDFSGRCCREGIVAENERECCPPARIAANAIFPRCCPSVTLPDAARRECVELPPLPLPDLPLPRPEPPAEPETPQTPETPPTTVAPAPQRIGFQYDRPGSGGGTLAASLTAAGRTAFAALVAALRADATLKVRLIGRASAEGTDDYNLALGHRRAALIAAELEAAGIARTRIADPPAGTLDAACEAGAGPGLASCGEHGSAAWASADREVRAELFVAP